MANGYFQLVNDDLGYGIKLIPPTGDGEPVRLNEVMDYLSSRQMSCAPGELTAAASCSEERVIHLGAGECPVENENYTLHISEDNMTVTARFYAPSETGQRMNMEEFVKDLRFRKVVYGIQMLPLQEHFQEGMYCTDLEVALGKEAVQGTDARIEYYFNTDVQAKPTLREDGSVDFFHLNTINHCQKGEMLARIIPEVQGVPGTDVLGVKIKPRDVKRAVLKFGRNIELSEDKLSISSLVDGHVTLVDDKVFVSDIFTVENVDNSTGNIEFQGSVQVNGNVTAGFSVKAKRNVIVNGVVEGADIEAGGDIIIGRGMNGMHKGVLKASGNVVSKFLENTTVEAKGYVKTGSILHSQVMAGGEIEVEGKRGFITGGHVCAGNKITVKTLGAVMGASTLVEVGVSPELRNRYQVVLKEINDLVHNLKNAQPVLSTYAEKMKKGMVPTEQQKEYIRSIAAACETQKKQLAVRNAQLKTIQEQLELQSRAVVIVTGEVFPGTTIVIGDTSKLIQTSYKYCRFEREGGEVRMKPM